MDQQERLLSVGGNGRGADREVPYADVGESGDAQPEVVGVADGKVEVVEKVAVEKERVEEEVEVEASPIRLAVVTLPDRSTYAGQASTDGIPNGFGVLTTVFGSVYAGQLKGGMKEGVGVETGMNGSTYAGEFADDKPSGYGVHTSALGDKYIGQWREGSRHGVGMCIDADARVTLARFDADEPELHTDSETNSINASASDESDDQRLLHVKRAFFAEMSAISSQETARANQLAATLQDDITVDGHVLKTPEDVERLEANAQAEVDAFICAQDTETAELAAAASVLKIEEAQLAQRQKQLRQEIAARGQELARVARFCNVAAARQAEVQEARRALDMLQRQCAALVHLDASISTNENTS